MAVSGVNAYLNFNGAAAEAIAFYEQAIDATIVMMQRFGDAPGHTFTDEEARHVMHARLDIGGGFIMISDGMPGAAVTPGSNIWVCIQYDNVDEIDGHYAALAEGGTATVPLNDTFWGARFGMLVDRFGIPWMMNAELPK